MINNGATKGASPEHFLTIRSSPGLEDIWQLHYSLPRDGNLRLYETSRPGGPDLNTSQPRIANLDETTAHHLELTARADGSFALSNPRNGYTKEYPPVAPGRQPAPPHTGSRMADDVLDEVLRRVATVKDLADLRRELARLRADFTAEQARTRRALWAVGALVAAAVLLAA